MSFLFSIVMPVFNVESFLKEAIDSVLHQDIGVDKVQLILVDDGSTDRSGEICDECGRRLPKNTIVVHTENRGLSAARNEGIKYATGKYICFFDSDDKLSENALSRVFAFFSDHGSATDVVSLPMIYFDAASGDHPLNYKYKKGTRVIDLTDEWDNPQLSISSCFIRLSAIRGLFFDRELNLGEDMKFALQLLMQKKTLGVIAEAAYYYRKRSKGSQSLLQDSSHKAHWYLDSLNNLTESVINHALDVCDGKVPLFVQNTLLYELKWKFQLEHRYEEVINKADFESFRMKLCSIAASFDDLVIMKQHDFLQAYKAYLLYNKHGYPKLDGNRFIFSDNAGFDASGFQLTIYFIEFQKDHIVLAGGFPQKWFITPEPLEVYLKINDSFYPCSRFDRMIPKYSLEIKVQDYYGFQVILPPEILVEHFKIRFYYFYEGTYIPCRNIHFSKFAPLSDTLKQSYARLSQWILTEENGMISFDQYSKSLLRRRKKEYRNEIKLAFPSVAKTIILAQKFASFIRRIKRNEVWILSDRLNKAGDNGEALFNYLCEKKPKGIRFYFELSKKSPDFALIKKEERLPRFSQRKTKCSIS